MGVHANLCTPKNGDILVAATQVRTTASSPEVSNRRLALRLQHRLGRPCVLEHFPAGSNTLAGSCGIGLTRDCTLNTAGLLDVLLPHHLQGHLLHPRAVRAANGLHGRRSGCCHAAAASHRRAAGAHSMCPNVRKHLRTLAAVFRSSHACYMKRVMFLPAGALDGQAAVLAAGAPKCRNTVRLLTWQVACMVAHTGST